MATAAIPYVDTESEVQSRARDRGPSAQPNVAPVDIVLVASHPPRRCGIATFTADLGRGLSQQPRVHVHNVAIDPQGEAFLYGRNVIGHLQQGSEQSYLETARTLARGRCDVVSIQHEYGLWGIWGDDGLEVDFTAPFIQEIKRGSRRHTVVTTLHTVRPNPTALERETLRNIVELSDATVVMVRMAAMVLMDDYGISPNTIVRIPHGVPVVERRPRRFLKRRLGVEGRTTISTLGLLDPRKGIEYAIGAMGQIVDRHPEALYLIVGETHPEYRKRSGEEYRNELRRLVRELNLEGHVRFVNQFLNDREIVDYLQASDIYVTPYLDRNQITSGTLAFAVGTGKAIISTPYPHATEALAEGRGLLAELRSAESLAHCFELLLDNPDMRQRLEQRTAEYGNEDSWPQVGARYADLYRRLVTGEPIDDLLAVQLEGVTAG